MTTFVQLSARLKNFLRGWLLVLVLKEGLVECATVYVKSVVILTYIFPSDKTVSSSELKFDIPYLKSNLPNLSKWWNEIYLQRITLLKNVSLIVDNLPNVKSSYWCHSIFFRYKRQLSTLYNWVKCFLRKKPSYFKVYIF